MSIYDIFIFLFKKHLCYSFNMKKKITFFIGVLFLIVIVWGITAIGLKQSHAKANRNIQIDFDCLV